MKEAIKTKKKHAGSNFDDFLKEENILEKVENTALKRVIAFQRKIIAKEIKSARADFLQGKAKKVSVDGLMNELLK